ncbi:MAG: hypothetical protein ACRDOE_05560, partial [Streptosporangiaceae bacterium]
AVDHPDKNASLAGPGPGPSPNIFQRLHALAACIWNNWRTGASDKRFLVAYDHLEFRTFEG